MPVERNRSEKATLSSSGRKSLSWASSGESGHTRFFLHKKVANELISAEMRRQTQKTIHIVDFTLCKFQIQETVNVNDQNTFRRFSWLEKGDKP